ncbi:ABC transporter permease [Paludibacterium purpuratum]|uniref:ABC-2 type transport system permease protein n=1 Tax=Paludibacterium purpuratum TaxID=1144873 RepID=A0A4R7B830_9NEIS|nr:ABC transporter permease [Paludibacterium purpuratum]TDR79747.1 ABC-2 type transport system permease protein [Paludibacterium purpuratum]
MAYRLWTLIVKELQSLLRDRQGRLLLIMPVLVQVLVFPFSSTLEVKNSTLAVFNQDSGAASVEVLQRLASTEAFPHVLMVHGDDELRAAIDEQRALLAIRFPEDFSRKLARGQSAPLQALIDGRRSNSAQIAFSYAQAVVNGYVADQLAARGVAPPSTLAVQNLYNPNLVYRWFVLPSLVAIITTIGALIVTALSLAREREEGTFEQLLVSPLTPGLIMVGKAVPAMIVATIQGSIIAAVAVWAYGVPFTGSLLLFYGAILCYGLSLVGFGLLISSVCATQQQAFLGVFSFTVPAVVLSGYLAPVENMPAVLRYLSFIDPLRHFIVIVKGLFLKQFDIGLVWPHLWPLLLIAVLTLTAAYTVFRRKVA